MKNEYRQSRARKVIAALKDKDKVRILFVCLGNICRSPAAEGVFRAMAESKGVADRFELDSCGFYGGHAGEMPDYRMRQHGSRRGYDFTHRSRRIRPHDMEDFDLIIGMDDDNIDSLHDLARTPEEEAKIFRMTDFCRRYADADCVPDPYYGGAASFENVLDLLEDACSSMLDEFCEKRQESE